MTLLDLLDRPIAFHRPFVEITGSITAALFLSQCLYWSKRTTDPECWFYKKAEEWQEETGMTRREQEGARKTLKALGLLEEKLKGVPATLYFRLNKDALLAAIKGAKSSFDKTAKLDSPKPPSQIHQNGKTISETTAEITAQREAQSALPLAVETGKKRFTPPSKQEVTEHFKSLGMNGSAEKEAETFVNYYEARGWMMGKVKMQKWKAAATNWKNRQDDRNAPPVAGKDESAYWQDYPAWIASKGPKYAEFKDHRYAPDFIKTEYHKERKAQRARNVTKLSDAGGKL